MQCSRAAVVRYHVVASPLEFDGQGVPDDIAASLTVEARIHRRLLTCDSAATGWPDVVAWPIFDVGVLTVEEMRHVLKPEQSIWREWRRQTQRRAEIEQDWRMAVNQLSGTVPRKKLEELVAQHLSEEERRLLRFSLQVDYVLALPTDSSSMRTCQAIIEELGQWVDTVAMLEIAEEFYRLTTRTAEDVAVLRADLRERNAALTAAAEEQFRSQAARGYCVPEEQYALLDDTLFIFDGQFGPDEMRQLMAEYMGDLHKRMIEAAVADDRGRDAAVAERPEEIPEWVRAAVWRRDQGRCVVCLATSDLEFDHIIPRSKGGASTTRNVQVLCTRCNQKKSAQVAREQSRRQVGRASHTLSLFGDDIGVFPSGGSTAHSRSNGDDPERKAEH